MDPAENRYKNAHAGDLMSDDFDKSGDFDKSDPSNEARKLASISDKVNSFANEWNRLMSVLQVTAGEGIYSYDLDLSEYHNRDIKKWHAELANNGFSCKINNPNQLTISWSSFSENPQANVADVNNNVGGFEGLGSLFG